MDYKCNQDCPAKMYGRPVCCCACNRSRLYFVTNENKHLWDDTLGFWSEKGCKLNREDMPKECKEYDCRREAWAVLRYWSNGWHDIEVGVAPKNQEFVDGIFAKTRI